MKILIDAVSQCREHEFYISERIKQIGRGGSSVIFVRENYSATFEGIKEKKLDKKGWIKFYFSVLRARNVEFLAVNPKIMVLCSILRILQIEVCIHPHAYGETICNDALKYSFFWRLFFSLKGDILVNSQGIKNRFCALNFICSSSVHNISHPLFPFDKTFKEKRKKPVIRFVGVAHENKGIYYFLDLAKKFGSCYDFFVNETAARDFCFNNSWVSEIEYRALLIKSDLIFCFYPETSYHFYASGTVLDAVSARTPLVTSNFAFARDVFQQHSDNFIFSKKELEGLLRDPLAFSEHLESTSPLLEKIKSNWLCQALEVD